MSAERLVAWSAFASGAGVSAVFAVAAAPKTPLDRLAAVVPVAALVSVVVLTTRTSGRLRRFGYATTASLAALCAVGYRHTYGLLRGLGVDGLELTLTLLVAPLVIVVSAVTLFAHDRPPKPHGR